MSESKKVKRKKSKLKTTLLIISAIMFASGMGLVLFPPTSNFVGKQIADSIIEEFDESVENMQEEKSYSEAYENGEVDEEGYPIDENGVRISTTVTIYKLDIDRLYKDSVAYNEDLKSSQYSKLTNEYAYSVPSLDLTDYGIFDGVYGYVSAPDIDMKLPIYLGANSSTMSYGAAHLTYTSLPIGGESTNTVLAGHTGYVGRIFFDNIRKLDTGDEVSITNYWDTIKYRVTEKKTVAPNEAQDIYIKEGEDLLTLVTCVSDGNGGFNRCLVICERV